MSCNVGGLERTARFAVGGALLTGGILGSRQEPGAKTAAILTGAIMLATAATQYCPLNAALGVNTCPEPAQDENAPELIHASRPTAERVNTLTASDANAQIRSETLDRVEAAARGGPEAIERRLKELDREWDLERVLEAEAGSTILAGLALGAFVNRRFYWVPVFAGFMGMLHALHGAYPLLPLFRRMGLRTPEEIHKERLALRLLQGQPLGSVDELKAAA